jgi:hypothetical protein
MKSLSYSNTWLYQMPQASTDTVEVMLEFYELFAYKLSPTNPNLSTSKRNLGFPRVLTFPRSCTLQDAQHLIYQYVCQLATPDNPTLDATELTE